jgi:probable phosphoglycerate mutase
VAERVLAGRDRIVAAYDGKTVLVVSHVTPIKTLVADALGAPLEALFRMELSPASVTVISYFEGRGPEEGRTHPNLRLYNARPTEAPFV